MNLAELESDTQVEKLGRKCFYDLYVVVGKVVPWLSAPFKIFLPRILRALLSRA